MKIIKKKMLSSSIKTKFMRHINIFYMYLKKK